MRSPLASALIAQPGQRPCRPLTLRNDSDQKRRRGWRSRTCRRIVCVPPTAETNTRRLKIREHVGDWVELNQFRRRHRRARSDGNRRRHGIAIANLRYGRLLDGFTVVPVSAGAGALCRGSATATGSRALVRPGPNASRRRAATRRGRSRYAQGPEESYYKAHPTNPITRIGLRLRKLPQYHRKDSAVAVVFYFYRCIDPHDQHQIAPIPSFIRGRNV